MIRLANDCPDIAGPDFALRAANASAAISSLWEIAGIAPRYEPISGAVRIRHWNGHSSTSLSERNVLPSLRW